MKKRIISLLLVLSIIFSLMPAAVAYKDVNTMTSKEKEDLLKNPFNDVAETDWYYDAVQYVRINSIFNGTSDTSFNPAGAMTRGMFVTVLGRMAGVDAEDYEDQAVFTDVPADRYYAPFVAWAAKHGITTGTGNGEFSPNTVINRQQMATFFVRYFETFDVDYETDANATTEPADIDSVSPYAKEAVLKLWETGLLNGDGTNFNPTGLATRSQTATLAMRTDETVKTWYKEPGVASARVRIDPEDLKSVDYSRSVYFVDDEGKVFDVLSTIVGTPLGGLPSVEKSSKEGYVLLGYYTDPEYTEPFYAENPVTSNMWVYAKYHKLDDNTLLNLTTFAQMDQDPSLSFTITKAGSGSAIPADKAATLITKDGSDPVSIKIVDKGDGTYTVSAVNGFNKGCTYELCLADGWIFAGKAETIRSASFSIKMEEVENLRMSEDIVFIADNSQMDYVINYKIGNNSLSDTHAVLTADAMSIENADPSTISGSFTYAGAGNIKAGDMLCIYVGLHPNERIARSNDDDPTNDGALMDPAVYVKAKEVSAGGVVTFVPLDDADQEKLYEIPDLFPFLVTELPATSSESLTIAIDDLDLSFYETSMGAENGTVAKAKEKASPRDFVVLYTQLVENPAPGALFYGRVTAYDSESGTITYTPCAEADLLNCMDLYTVVDIQGSDLVSPQQQQELEAALYDQVEESGFAEEAAYILADLVSKTDGFQDNLRVQDLLLTDGEGNPLSEEDIQLLNIGGSFELTDDVELTVELVTEGDQLHYNKGVQLAIGVDASFEVDAEDGKVAIDLSATFVQEVSVVPSVKGDLTHTTILGVKIPNGVKVDASVDVKSYTALSFAAEIYTVAEEDAGLWEQMQNIANNPESVLGLVGIPADLASGLETVSDVMDKIDELQNAIDRGTLAAAKTREYTQDIQDLWSALESNGLASKDEWETLGEALGKTSITSDLMDIMDISAETGLSAEYYDSVEKLMQKYSDTVTKETDWIKLLEKEIFATQVYVSAICIGVEVSFVVRADMSIAIGSNLEYEVGKRYSFWFKIGLYTPTAGNSTTDLIDEHFAFQFYVMGKLGLKAGIRAELYAAIGSKSVASVGIAVEMGPYIKLWGFFVYEYSKYRPANTQDWTYNERMAGALYMEFGLYFMLSFEAQALSLFEYSHDFLDEEIPLLNAGTARYYYECHYDPEVDEVVIVRDENSDSTDGVTMALPEELWALSYVDLDTGRMGSESLHYSKYKFSVTSPYFTVTDDGKISVEVPEDVRFLECDLTITYLNGKMAFSDYDMSVTIPLVWTNLGMDELKEYYTASVRVGNDTDGYDTVWTKKLLKRQPFDLPTTQEVKEMIGWSDTKYQMAGGYGSQTLTNLTIIDNVNYDFKINYPTYSITVTGIQNPDGSTRSETFTAKYGKSFDFSSLEETGTNLAGSTYTRFVGVSTEATVMVNGNPQTIDLSQPINGKVAAALQSGITAKANYVDDSVKAIFSFTGITAEDVAVTLRRGETPSDLSAVQRVVDAAGDEGIVIASITPALSSIYSTTNYEVTCVEPNGERNTVNFDLQGGSYMGSTTIEPVDKLIGSLLVNLPTAPEVSRVGYDFDGWFTEPKDLPEDMFVNSGENALTQTVPDKLKEAVDNNGSITVTDPFENLNKPNPTEFGKFTIYAQWTPKTVDISFDLNGGAGLYTGEDFTTIADSKMTVVYDSSFGGGYKYTENAANLKALAAVQLYGSLPFPYRDDQHGFAGWYCDFDGDGVKFEEGELVTDDTPVTLLQDQVLYARWKKLVEIPRTMYSVTSSTVTYDGEVHIPTVTQNTNPGKGSYYYLDSPSVLHYVDYPTEGYEIDYKRQGAVQYEKRSEGPHVAGTYDTLIERPRDNTFAKMSWYYGQNTTGELFKIEKASSSIQSYDSLTAEKHGRAVFAKVNISSWTGDAAPVVEFAVSETNSAPTSGWNSRGAFYNLDSNTTYYLWARLGESMNYKASAPVGSVSFTTSGANSFSYRLVVHTANVDSAGTDSNIYATIGGSKQHLDPDSGDNFEKNDTDVCKVSIPGTVSMEDGNIDVTISAEKKGSKPGWMLGSLRMDVYEGSSRIKTGTERTVDQWFLASDHGNVTAKTYELSGVGRRVNTGSYGLSLSDSTISINSAISDNYKSNYDPFTYNNAPRFVAYFGSSESDHSIFNAYITRTSFTSFNVDWDGLKEAMDEYRISSLTLHYGIDYADSTGIYGAADCMSTKTVDIGQLDYKD